MASAAIGWLLTFDQMPQGVAAWVSGQRSRQVAGDSDHKPADAGARHVHRPARCRAVLTPVFVPLAQGIGMDMTQLGIMMVVNLAIGLYTPPWAPRCSSPARWPRSRSARRYANWALLPGGLRCPCARVLRARQHPALTRACRFFKEIPHDRHRLDSRGTGASCPPHSPLRLRMGEVQGQGYIGQALGWADVLAVTYRHALKPAPAEPEWRAATLPALARPLRDRPPTRR